MAVSIYISSRVLIEHKQQVEENPILEKIWTENRRYQIAGLLFFAMMLTAACVGILESSNVQQTLTVAHRDEDYNSSTAAKEMEQSTLVLSSVKPVTWTLSSIPSVIPSLQPSNSDSDYPSLAPTSHQPTHSLAPSLSPSLLPSTSIEPTNYLQNTFGIYVMGDVPYASWEERILQLQLASLRNYSNPSAQFIVHVGDIQKPQRTGCAESRFAMVSSIMKTAPLPTLVLAGDNDWSDCKTPEMALEYYHSYFDYFHLNWNATTTATDVTNLSLGIMSSRSGVPNYEDMNGRLNFEHHSKYPEMWRIYINGILLLSVQNVNYKGLINDAYNRTLASINWVRSSIRSDTFLQAVIIFGHGQFGEKDNTKVFFEGIYDVFSNVDRLSTTVMYFHGDGHQWSLSGKVQRYLNWPAFVDVQVDQGGYADPLLVEFSIHSPLQLEHELQYVFANGKIRIDRQRGRYPLQDGKPNINDLFPMQGTNR